MNREDLALTVACPACRADAGRRCYRLTPHALRRVVSRRHIMHPHAERVAVWNATHPESPR